MAHTDDRIRTDLAARPDHGATPSGQVPPGRRQRTWLLLVLAAGLTLLTVGLLRGHGPLIATGLILAGVVECLLNRHRHPTRSGRHHRL
ncbi:hypothetical protein [Sphaerisporangium aureirubrum]|uniref:DUF3040 domain-containing protein n=1 Tax=Sphaerisporangium aureirubrum TaxID=1544736 RepID=A0ABW1NGJ2_9ACTN